MDCHSGTFSEYVKDDLNRYLLSIGQWNGDSYGEAASAERISSDLDTSLPITCNVISNING